MVQQFQARPTTCSFLRFTLPTMRRCVGVLAWTRERALETGARHYPEFPMMTDAGLDCFALKLVRIRPKFC